MDKLEEHGIYVEKDNVDELIESVYYSPKTGYIGVNKLYEKLKPYGITQNKIRDFLRKQSLYQIHQSPPMGSFVPHYPLQEFQIDLIYLENKNLNNNAYGLTCIDAFTKKADIELLKKKDETNIIQAMKNILKRMGIPDMIYCDEGSEFTSNAFKKLCDENDIELILSLRHASICERFHRTFKALLYKYLEASKSKTITNVLPDLLHNYNTSYHRTIGMTPEEACKPENTNTVYENIFNASTTVFRPEIKVGDKVRVLLKEIGVQTKKYKPQYSETIYTVEKIMRPYYYVNNITKGYLRAYLMKVPDGTVNKDVDPSEYLKGTKEEHIKELSKITNQPKSDKQEETQPIESIAINRPRREIKKPDYYTIAK